MAKKTKAKKTIRKTKASIRKSKPTARRRSDGKIYDIPHYPQTEEFTSSAACAMMVLKYINKNFKARKEEEFLIWQDAVNGSVWHGSRYGLAYALAKRGAKASIVSNSKGEGYEKKLAVFEGINVDTLHSSFEEIKGKAKELKITESFGTSSISAIKKHINSGLIPIVIVNANMLNPYLESSPHWIVVKGYDKDLFYINDPYSDSTITMGPQEFKNALGYETEHNMILVSARRSSK
jgi:uncharacterized protein YvpB